MVYGGLVLRAKLPQECVLQKGRVNFVIPDNEGGRADHSSSHIAIEGEFVGWF